MDLHDEQDQRLARQAAAGDETAFATLVSRHRGALVQFVTRRTGRATIAEDAVQEALLSAHRALRRGEPPRDVRAWLHTIAWRRAVDLLRQEAPAADGCRFDVAATVDGPDVLVLEAADFELMLRQWRRLPHRQRHALAMSVLEGRSLGEIGGALGVSPDAAKSLVARSRRSLAAAITDSQRPCEEVSRAIDVAAAAGRRLPPSVSRHVDGCRECARSHRLARRGRRQRALLLLPAGLVERAREIATFMLHNEQPVSLMTKACAGACAVALAGGGSAAFVATAPVGPTVLRATERPAEKKRERRARKTRPAGPARTPVAASTPVATAAPTRRATQRSAATSLPTTVAPAGTTGGSDDRNGTVRTSPRRPEPLPAAGKTAAPAASPSGAGDPAAPQPLPGATPVP